MRPSTLAVGCLLSIAPIFGAPAVAGARQEGPAVDGPTFFAVQVEDVEAMAAWYARVFGLEVVNRLHAEDGRYAIRILSGGGLTVELIQLRGTTRPEGVPQGHFKAGFYVTDIEAFHRKLIDQSVDADEQIFTDEALSARSFVFRDPEGNRLQAFSGWPAQYGPVSRDRAELAEALATARATWEERGPAQYEFTITHGEDGRGAGDEVESYRVSDGRSAALMQTAEKGRAFFTENTAASGSTERESMRRNSRSWRRQSMRPASSRSSGRTPRSCVTGRCGPSITPAATGSP